jgi:hypothetical protein
MAILSVFVGSIFMTMGFYGSGPLGQILYRESFIHRTNFWDAGIAMMAKNLLSGVGIDQFGDSYREYRSQNAVDLRGPEVSSDSAHNIAIDIGAGGGIIPFSLYLVIQITILVCGFRLMLKIEKGNILPIGIFSLWFGYQAQTLISINQIGVSVWGWILSGSIVAQFINLSNVKAKERVRGSGSNERIKLMRFLLFGIVGLSISLPPLLKDSDFRNALKSQNGLEIIRAAKSWPENTFYLNYASVLLNSNGYRDEAIELSRLAVKLNPRNYIGWKLIMQSTVEGSPERLEAIRVMRKLDPLNKEIPKR